MAPKRARSELAGPIDDNTLFQALRDQVLAHGGEVSSAWQMRTSVGGDRIIVAGEATTEGQVLLRIPRSYVFAVDDALARPETRSLRRAAAGLGRSPRHELGGACSSQNTEGLGFYPILIDTPARLRLNFVDLRIIVASMPYPCLVQQKP